MWVFSDSVFLVEDEETDDGDDGERHEDLDHVDDDVLVNGHLDDNLVPAEHAKADVLATLLLIFKEKGELLKGMGNGVRKRWIEEIEIVSYAKVPLGIVIGEALVLENVLEVRMQD